MASSVDWKQMWESFHRDVTTAKGVDEMAWGSHSVEKDRNQGSSLKERECSKARQRLARRSRGGGARVGSQILVGWMVVPSLR